MNRFEGEGGTGRGRRGRGRSEYLRSERMYGKGRWRVQSTDRILEILLLLFLANIHIHSRSHKEEQSPPCTCTNTRALPSTQVRKEQGQRRTCSRVQVPLLPVPADSEEEHSARHQAQVTLQAIPRYRRGKQSSVD